MLNWKKRKKTTGGGEIKKMNKSNKKRTEYVQ